MNKLVFTILSSVFLLSFFQEQTEYERFTPLMKERYDSAVNEYLSNRRTKCFESILEDAESYVDSVIINEINILLLDTIIFPQKPQKPNYPDTIILNDSINIKPE